MWYQAIVRELPVVLESKLATLYAIRLAFFQTPDERELTLPGPGQLRLGEPRNGATPNYQFTTRTGERDGY